MAPRTRPVLTAALVLATLGVAGCASDAPKVACPATQTVPNAGTLVAFTDGEQVPSARRFAARIAGMNVACQRVESERGAALSSKLTIRLRTEKGPALQSPRVGYRYFVAVLNREGDVVARRAFPVKLDFSGNATTLRTTETVTQRVPLPGEGAAGGYTIYAGFELSEAQLRYNRNNPG
ncbi:hypothetical protein SAMN05216241_10349 [Limimonas halophila]|uniref:Lipoprotein n=1 Tax=Limimonas halophila TaxID=1082479 RepID=A0A1G7PSH7_9PROT|nr:hypothetical protein [Limimonas halophila]SDF89184.1 hypothetical protein SAMN05216241_10349 [Limimonas halophila]